MQNTETLSVTLKSYILATIVAQHQVLKAQQLLTSLFCVYMNNMFQGPIKTLHLLNIKGYIYKQTIKVQKL